MYTGYETAISYKRIAENKTNSKWYKTFILAIFAGLFIALAGVLATIAGTASEGIAATLIKAAVFPVGIILVVLTGSELFTGNCLLFAPTLNKDIKWVSLFKNLSIVYAGNFVGAVLIAVICIYSGILSDAAVNAAVSVTVYKSNLNFGEALLRAVPCNVLVCFGVWCSMLCKSATGKILAVYFPIFTFVVCGFEHSVANMYYLSAGMLASLKYGIALNTLNIGNALLNGLLAGTIGNILGGTVFVALPLWLVFFRNNDVVKSENAK